VWWRERRHPHSHLLILSKNGSRGRQRGRSAASKAASKAGLLIQGVPGVPQDPLAPRRGPLGSSPDRGGAVGNAPALVPGPLTRLQELQLLTELSPQVKGRAKLGMNWHSTVALCTYHMLVYRSMS
jgi:hypothetical protein